MADVFNLGTRYRATEKLSFTGEFECVHGNNTSFGHGQSEQSSGYYRVVLSRGTAPYNIGQYSLVKMESFRFGVGADYCCGRGSRSYVRYNYYDYHDDSGTTSGQANMILGGMSARF